MLTLLKKLLRIKPTDPPTILNLVDGTNIPQWKTEIVVHPQYWIESNFSVIEKVSPIFKKFLERALQEKHISNITADITLDAAKLIHETFIIQLNAYVPQQEGAWNVSVQNSLLQARMKVYDDANWPNVMRAWSITKDVIHGYGLELHDVEEEWDRQNLSGIVKVQIGKLKFKISSIILWNVLHRNKKRVILWNGKLWIPNNV